jgi:hypothetical protein
MEGRVVIDVSRKYVSIFRCDGTGAILDSDHFAYPYRLDRQDAVSSTLDVYSIIYDWLNRELNGNSASDADQPPHSK